MSSEDDVQAASRRFYKALNKMVNGDSSSMADAWSHGASVTALHPVGGRTVGWEAVAASFAQVAGMSSGGKVELKEQVIQVGGDMAFEIGFEDGSLTMAGEPVVIDHRVTNVYRQEDGGWRMVHHHTDTSPAMLDLLARLQAAAG